jgi:hypothetical protein
MYCKRYMQEHHSAFLALCWLAPDPQIHLKIVLDMDYKLAIAIYLGTIPNVWCSMFGRYARVKSKDVAVITISNDSCNHLHHTVSLHYMHCKMTCHRCHMGWIQRCCNQDNDDSCNHLHHPVSLHYRDHKTTCHKWLSQDFIEIEQEGEQQNKICSTWSNWLELYHFD